MTNTHPVGSTLTDSRQTKWLAKHALLLQGMPAQADTGPHLRCPPAHPLRLPLSHLSSLAATILVMPHGQQIK